MKLLKHLSGILVILFAFGLYEASGQWGWNSPHIYNSNAGNVGIGLNTPATLLHVAKNMTEPTITVQNLGSNGGATYSMVDNASGANWKFKATQNGGFKIRDHANGMDVFTIEPSSVVNALYIKTGGNVGIRTNSPVANFQVAENFPSFTGLFGSHISSWPYGTNVSIGDDNNDAVLYVGQSLNNKGYLYWVYNSTPANAYFNIGTYSGSNPLILQGSGGNVGLGTTNPNARMEIMHNISGYTYLAYNQNTTNFIFHDDLSADGDGQTGLYAYRNGNNNHGTGYSIGTSNTAMRGYSYWGTEYSFGTAGFNYLDFYRCGGILGADVNGFYWGALGYKNSGGAVYGGYFTTYTTGSGKGNHPASLNIGLGAWGDLFGADIHGKVYGIYAEGGNYAMFSNGDVYKNKLDVHLQENGTATHTALYTNVSTDVTVMTSGFATLAHGKADIAFDPAFAASVSASEPIVVTVTPAGSSNGVFLSGVTINGFSVTENNAGKSNVTINYIAIGRRAGFENPVLSPEVIMTDYTTKLARGLNNDADTQTNGEGLYYENGQLVVGIHLSTLPDANKPRVEFAHPDERMKITTGESAGKQTPQGSPER